MKKNYGQGNNKRNQRSEAKGEEKRSMKATKMVIGLKSNL
jgi:hypothetical protein